MMAGRRNCENHSRIFNGVLIMVGLDSIFVFIPDISIFQDAFVLKSIEDRNDMEKSAKDFFNFLAEQTEKTGFKYLRTPVEFTVKLLNDPLFKDNMKIWKFLSLILGYEINVCLQDVSSEKEIIECYKHLNKYKKPLIICNRKKDVYSDYETISTKTFMRVFKDAMLKDRIIPAQ